MDEGRTNLAEIFALNPADPTSSSLLRGAMAREPEAWERLVSLYSPLVHHWCRQSGISGHEVADVTQEVFAAVAANLGQFQSGQPGTTFRGWMRGITRHKLLDHAARPGRAGHRRDGCPGPAPSGPRAGGRARALGGSGRRHRAVPAGPAPGPAPGRGPDLEGLLEGDRRVAHDGGSRRGAGDLAQCRPTGQVARAPPPPRGDGRADRLKPSPVAGCPSSVPGPRLTRIEESRACCVLQSRRIGTGLRGSRPFCRPSLREGTVPSRSEGRQKGPRKAR